MMLKVKTSGGGGPEEVVQVQFQALVGCAGVDAQGAAGTEGLQL